MRAGLRLLGWGLLAAMAACAPLPHPFQHETTPPLVADQDSLYAVAIAPVDAAPGLAEAMVRALAKEDIAATTEGGGTRMLRLAGTADGGGVNWHLDGADGQSLGDVRQAAGAPPPARAVAALIRGRDWGLDDIDARPHVAVRPVRAPATVDGAALARVMARALARQDLTIDETGHDAIVEGTLTVTRSAGSRDLVQLRWRVLGPNGAEVAVVTQAGEMARADLAGDLGVAGRDMAEAGAGTLAGLVRKTAVRPAPPSR